MNLVILFLIKGIIVFGNKSEIEDCSLVGYEQLKEFKGVF